MKLDKRMTAVLAVGLLAAAAWAQDNPNGASASQTHASATTAGIAHRHHPAKSRRARFNYQRCVKENLADAEYFCQSHPGEACDAEKKGAVKQCKEEARGVKFTG
jgi:hypothetical protein